MSKHNAQDFVYPDTSPKPLPVLHRGITRRDLAAIQIAKGIWSDQGHVDFLMDELDGDTDKVCQKISEMAYRQSDSLIAEGNKETP